MRREEFRSNNLQHTVQRIPLSVLYQNFQKHISQFYQLIVFEFARRYYPEFLCPIYALHIHYAEPSTIRIRLLCTTDASHTFASSMLRGTNCAGINSSFKYSYHLSTLVASALFLFCRYCDANPKSGWL